MAQLAPEAPTFLHWGRTLAQAGEKAKVQEEQSTAKLVRATSKPTNFSSKKVRAVRLKRKKEKKVLLQSRKFARRTKSAMN